MQFDFLIDELRAAHDTTSVNVSGLAVYVGPDQLDRGVRRRMPVSERIVTRLRRADYSGKKIGIADARTGVIREAEIFVGVLVATTFSNMAHRDAAGGSCPHHHRKSACRMDGPRSQAVEEPFAKPRSP